MASSSNSGGKQQRIVGNYVLGKQIGTGSSAMVWKSTHVETGEKFAIKEIDNENLFLSNEISILSSINHPNIVQLLEVVKHENKTYLVLEYCNGGNLMSYIHKRKTVPEDDVARHFMRQLAAGLKALHEKRIIHGDLKFEADLWSVGIILFQLVTRTFPQFNRSLFKNLRPDYKDLCMALLRQDPAERLTHEEFFNHRFLEEPRIMPAVESSLAPQLQSIAMRDDTRPQPHHDSQSGTDKNRDSSSHSSSQRKGKSSVDTFKDETQSK